jgi:hypothetical protein
MVGGDGGFDRDRRGTRGDGGGGDAVVVGSAVAVDGG